MPILQQGQNYDNTTGIITDSSGKMVGTDLLARGSLPVNSPFRTTGTQAGDIAAGLIANNTYNPNIPAAKTAPTTQVTLGSQPPAVDYNAIMAGLNTNVATDQTNVTNTQNKIATDTTALGNQSADQQTLEGQYGVVADQKGLNDLNAQMTALNNEANAQKIKIGDQPIEMNSITGQQNQVEHERTIKALGISAQIQAMQGNLKLANDQVDRALKLKYDPIKAEIDTLTKQLDYNYKNLTEAQKEKADAIKAQNDIKIKQLNIQQKAEADWAKVTHDALANNAPLKVVQQAEQLQKAGQEDAARALLSPYTGTKTNQVTGYDSNGNPVYYSAPKKGGTKVTVTKANAVIDTMFQGNDPNGNSYKGADGFVSPDDFNRAADAFVQEKYGTYQQFYNAHKSLANPKTGGYKGRVSNTKASSSVSI